MLFINRGWKLHLLVDAPFLPPVLLRQTGAQGSPDNFPVLPTASPGQQLQDWGGETGLSLLGSNVGLALGQTAESRQTVRLAADPGRH